MAKGGKFTKLIKKLSFGKTSTTKTTNINKTTSLESNVSFSSSSTSDTVSPTTLHTVYVGKSRRRYLLTTEVVNSPVFQQLIEGGDGEEITVGCEVVLFEHLLWMLDTVGPQPESLDGLVEFYSS